MDDDIRRLEGREYQKKIGALFKLFFKSVIYIAIGVF